MVSFQDLEQRVQPAGGLHRKEWRRHPNGGGWVQSSAYVGPDVYVSPESIVYHNAKVLDRSRLKGRTIIGGDAIIADGACIKNSVVTGSAIVRGKCVVRAKSHIGGFAVLEEGEHKGAELLPMSHTDQLRSWKVAKAYRNSENNAQR